LNLALGLETSITELLEQSALSLRDVAADLPEHPGAPQQAENVIAVLRTTAQLRGPRGTGLGLSDLMRLPARDEWYLPVTLDFSGGANQREVAFALVPVRRLIAGTDSLRLIPDSFVSLVTTDGRMLVSYAPGTGTFKPIRRYISPQSLKQISHRRSGVFLSLPSKGGYVGFARSAVIPLYVGASISTTSLRRQWLGEAAAPAAVLMIGIIAVLVFARQL